MKIACFVIGPAGSGKSTFCSTILKYAAASKRRMHLINLDPANKSFDVYEPVVDIRSLVTLEEVMTEMELGPNGGLIFALE